MALKTLQDALNNEQNYQFTHRADSTRAVAEYRRLGGRYDWIIMDVQAIAGGAKDVVHAIRAMGSQTIWDSPGLDLNDNRTPPNNTIRQYGAKWSTKKFTQASP